MNGLGVGVHKLAYESRPGFTTNTDTPPDCSLEPRYDSPATFERNEKIPCWLRARRQVGQPVFLLFFSCSAPVMFAMVGNKRLRRRNAWVVLWPVWNLAVHFLGWDILLFLHVSHARRPGNRTKTVGGGGVSRRETLHTHQYPSHLGKGEAALSPCLFFRKTKRFRQTNRHARSVYQHLNSPALNVFSLCHLHISTLLRI